MQKMLSCSFNKTLENREGFLQVKVEKFDEVTENTLMKYKNLIPEAQSVIIKGAAHMTMQDNPGENNAAISSFLVLD